MKRILFMIAPIIILMLAFRPVTSNDVTRKINDEGRKEVPVASIPTKESKEPGVINKMP